MRTETRSRSVDSLGNVQGSDILNGYRIYERDENAGGTSYYGFIDTDGNWYIMRDTVVGTLSTSLFAAGTSNFATNWTNRAILSYTSFDLLF